MLVNLGSMRKSYLSMWHFYTFLAKCLEVGRKTLLTMLYECVICMLIYVYIYICGSVFHIWLSQNIKITWNDQFMTYGYTNITNLYQSHYKITNFIHDFGPENETPRNHRIGLSARAVDPDLINHGNHGKGGKSIYTGIYSWICP